MQSSQDYNLRFQQELERLNLAQKQAVFHSEGPVLVIAGPGTGKTQILSARIGYILSSPNIQVSPQNILCLTYTDAGVIAMRNRLLKFIGPEAYRVHIHTFHSFCNQVIQYNMDYFGIRDLQPISELESIELFHKLIDDFPKGHPLKRYSGEIYVDMGRLKSLFSAMKTENWTPEFLSEKIDEYIADLPNREKFIYKVNKGTTRKGDLKLKLIQEETEKMEKLRAAAGEFDNFNRLMREMGRYDFDDMILWVLNAFKTSPNLKLRYQEQYLYFLVDEFQDTNGAQNEIINLLTEDVDENPNIFVVGDDDQSIYRFQGANLKNIMDFSVRYQRNLYRVVLTENYRSTQAILNAAQALIAFNSQRLVNTFPDIDKSLISSSAAAKRSDVIPKLQVFTNPQNEEAFILSEIAKLQQDGVDLSEVAVIYRKHRLVENLVKVMEQKKIPLNLKQRVNILKLPFIKNLINILIYIQQEYEKPHSSENLLFELMHYDFFSISPRDAARISNFCSRPEEGIYKKWRDVIASRELMLRLGLETARSISNLEDNITHWIKSLPSLTVQVLFEKIITQGGVLKYIMKSPERIWLMECLTTFFDFIKDHAEKHKDFTLTALLSLIEKMECHDVCIFQNKIISSTKGVNFVTAHSSKGLEFKYVFLISANANCWEKARSPNRSFRMPDTIIPVLDEDSEEEERRLFYVALTRAKEHLNVSYSLEDRKGKQQERSRFVSEIIEGIGLMEEYPQVDNEALMEFNFLNISYPEVAPTDIISKAFIDDTLRNYRMSVTHLSKYLRCPLAFYFENIIKVPSARTDSMGFGNAIHYTMEKFFKIMLESSKKFPSRDEFYEIFRKGMQRFHGHFTKEQFQRRLEYGQEILPDFYDKYINTWNKNTVVEYRFSNTEIDGVPVTGILDKLEFDGNSVNVVDYKTGKPENGVKKLSSPSENDPVGGDYWRQMVFYKMLMDSDRFKKWDMHSGEFDFIEKSAQKEYIKRKVIVGPGDVKIVKEQLKDVYGKILNHQFMPGCGKEDCQWCNFVKYNFATDLNLSNVEED